MVGGEDVMTKCYVVLAFSGRCCTKRLIIFVDFSSPVFLSACYGSLFGCSDFFLRHRLTAVLNTVAGGGDKDIALIVDLRAS